MKKTLFVGLTFIALVSCEKKSHTCSCYTISETDQLVFNSYKYVQARSESWADRKCRKFYKQSAKLVCRIE